MHASEILPLQFPASNNVDLNNSSQTEVIFVYITLLEFDGKY